MWSDMLGWQLSWIQFIHSVVYDSLQPHGLQHARLLCPSPTPGACSISCPSSRWCHPTISYSDVPFSSCLQSFPVSGFGFFFFFFQWVSSPHQVAKLLELQLQHQSFQRIFRTDERLLLWAVCYTRILDLQRRGFWSGVRDEAWLLGAFCVAKFY